MKEREDETDQQHLKCISEMRVKRDALILEIREAFAGATREGGVSVSEAYAIDHCESDEDREDARRSDRDEHWWQIDLVEFDPEGSALSFMDPIGFRYHFPACMTFALKRGFDADENSEPVLSLITDSVIFHACFPLSHTQFGLFNQAQLRCVAMFLAIAAQYALDEPFVSNEVYALRDTWLQYLTAEEVAALRHTLPDL